jgi:hypothetical protein
MSERYIWCGKRLELEIDRESGSVLLNGRPLREKLKTAEFTALVILVSGRGAKRSYLELVPESVAGDKGNRAQGVISQINRKTDGWLKKYLKPITVTVPGDERGYAFVGHVVMGNSPKDRDKTLRRISLSPLSLLSKALPVNFHELIPARLRNRNLRQPIIIATIVINVCLIGTFIPNLRQIAWRNLIYWRKPANVLVSNVIGYQQPFMPHFKEDKKYPVSWKGFYSIANLETRAVAVEGFTVEFQPFEYEGHIWQLKRNIDDPIFAQSFGSHEELVTYGEQQNYKYSPVENGPFILKAGETRYFVFQLDFKLFRDGKPCECDIESRDAKVFTQELIGGSFDEDDRPRCAFGPVRTVVKVHDSRPIEGNTLSFLGVEKCILTVPAGACRIPAKGTSSNP